MPLFLKKIFVFPDCTVIINADNKKIFDLVVGQICAFKKSETPQGNGRARLTIRFFYCKTSYRKLPRSKFDCFHGFTLFYNNFSEGNSATLDAGPRTLRTTVDARTKTITSYIATPPDFERDLLFDLIFFQPLKCLLQVYGMYFLHGSCVGKGKAAVLFAGASRSGKSTLALSLARSGFTYCADEETILEKRRQGIVCFGFPSKPKLMKQSLNLFPELKKVAARPSLKRGKILLADNPFLSRQTGAMFVPRMLIFPRWIKNSATRLEPVNKQAALSRLVREEFMYIRFAPRHVTKRHFFILASLLHQVSVYRLYYRDNELDKVPGLISPLLQGSRS